MSRSDRDKLEAEREARRAKRLSERAEQRARRKAQQAARAAERAAELAERAKRRSPRHRNLDRSIEDMVDDVTERWTRKAEDWMDQQGRELFGSGEDEDWLGNKKSGKRKSSTDWGLGGDSSDWDLGMGSNNDGFGTSQEDYEEDYDDESESRRRRRRSESARRAKRRERIKRRKARLKEEVGLAREKRRFKRRNRNGNLYRNKDNKKIFGVCSGIADYWAMEAWQVRFMAVFGIFVIPSIVIPGYFIASFLMDDKPYYRRVTDRFHELEDEVPEPTAMRSSFRERGPEKRRERSRSRSQSPEAPKVPNPQVLQQAKLKFADIEDRLRVMEGHVTSSKFELQRELRKISGDQA